MSRDALGCPWVRLSVDGTGVLGPRPGTGTLCHACLVSVALGRRTGPLSSLILAG